MEHFELNFLSYLLIATIALLAFIAWGERNNNHLLSNDYERLETRNEDILERYKKLDEKCDRRRYKREDLQVKLNTLHEETVNLRIELSRLKNLYNWNELKENQRLVHAARDLQNQIDDLHELHCIQRKQLTTIITNPTEPVAPLAPVKVEPFK